VTSYSNDHASRCLVVDAIRELVDKGLTSGSSGNVSVHVEDGMLITPTGVVPARMEPEHIVFMSLAGAVGKDQLTPSSEWRMHADIYLNKPGIEAVVHCHSNYATILACARKPIPALHYMIAATGSYQIPVARYETFGSRELSEANLEALQTSLACLLANHGQLATGFDLAGAMKLAALVEEIAHWYWGALAIGGPQLLNPSQMDDVLTRFATYGQQEKRGDLAD